MIFYPSSLLRNHLLMALLVQLFCINLKKLSLAGERTDENATISLNKQETALTIRCGAIGRANTHQRGDS